MGSETSSLLTAHGRQKHSCPGLSTAESGELGRTPALPQAHPLTAQIGAGGARADPQAQIHTTPRFPSVSYPTLGSSMAAGKMKVRTCLVEELTHLKRPWCWERLKAGEGQNRGWDGWMASPTRWTWVWINFWGFWWTERPGVLQSMGSQGVGQNWATELKSPQGLWRQVCTPEVLLLEAEFSWIFLSPPPAPAQKKLCWGYPAWSTSWLKTDQLVMRKFILSCIALLWLL